MRPFVAAAALAVFAMLAARWLLPVTNGTVGFTTTPITSTQLRVVAVSPGSPATSEGIRSGDVIRLDRMPVEQRIALYASIAGKPVDLQIDRGTQHVGLRIVPILQPIATSQTLEWIAFAFLYLGMALLVAWKAAPSRAAMLIVVFFVALASTDGLNLLASVLPSPSLYLTALFVLWLCVSVILISQLMFALAFPPRTSVMQLWIARLGAPIGGIVAGALILQPLVWGAYPEMWPVFHVVRDLAVILLSILIGLAVADGVRNGSAEYRISTIVAGSTLVLLGVMNIAYFGLNLFGVDNKVVDALLVLRPATGVGMAYAILRHRLVDLNLVISRAAIFSVVSLCVIALFVLIEWALSLMLQRALGSQFGPRGETALAAIVALSVGLSARSIHEVVKSRLNRVFFARRYRALADLRRYALETDAAMSAGPLVDLTLAILRRNLDAEYAEMYAGNRSLGYDVLGKSSPGAVRRFAPDDEIVLRLRRWTESFIVEIPEHVYLGALICPMVLRGTLYGFIVCGPKRDRSSYIDDEIDTLTSLAHRVGIAYEWLTRDRPFSSPSLAQPLSP
jgi:hypothetical protein